MSKRIFLVLGFLLLILLVIVFVAKDDSPEVSDVTQSAAGAPANTPDRSLRISESIKLPLPGSAPTTDVAHTVTIHEIRQGCGRTDCIPSIDDPVFISTAAAAELLPPESLGIALAYKSEQRFYPFPMLETHELVNDVVAGDPLVISYCPLCGTGIVFERTIDGTVMTFGVSGMLWNANLLMYNRADNVRDRNLWSQVLGEAVVGDRAGERLTIVPSDIMTFAAWAASNPNGTVLNSGRLRDPYGGAYYNTARLFAPNFDQRTSVLAPETYVYGFVVDDQPVAITRDYVVAEPEETKTIQGRLVTYTVNEHEVVTIEIDGVAVPDVEGFWFSYVAAYPNVWLWDSIE